LFDYIPISYINDYIFCPRSIYNHNLYANFDEQVYQDKPQRAGKNAHKAIDNNLYSNKKDVLMNYEIYSSKYGLYGKIDVYDIKNNILTERKNNITTIYDGYVYQLYAHYFGLTEMGYNVLKMNLYDYSKNITHYISLPIDDPNMLKKFENTIKSIKSFSLLSNEFQANINKCNKCIYKQLCDKSLC
jgi:CRISPR-associated exonuclease Cas4